MPHARLVEDHEHVGRLDELARRALRMELHDPHRQADRLGVVLAAAGAPLFRQRRIFGAQRQRLLHVLADVREPRAGHRALGLGLRGAAAERAEALPDAGEIGLAVRGPRGRRFEIRRAVGRYAESGWSAAGPIERRP